MRLAAPPLRWRAHLPAHAPPARNPTPQTHKHNPLRLPAAKPWVLAQRYVPDPLLIGGRKSGVRLWVLVTGVDPLRAYVSTYGLVLFSTEG